jgi:CO/xanthine dehydrogenase Mo-binding subunit
MARGGVLVILSDGWERGDPELVGREMARLARLAQRIVWVNPRMSASSFSVRAGGMVAALPHCAAISSATEKIRAKARLLAGMQLGAPADSLTWSNGAWVSGDGSDSAQVGTIADIAMYAHGSGELPPGVEGGLDAQTVYRD